MPHKHRPGHKLRKFMRERQSLFFAMFFLVLILGVVVLIFWLLTSQRFVRMG